MDIVHHRGHPTPADSFWHHYTDFPDIYDRAALSSVEAAYVIHEMIDFRDKHVLDVSSGTGKNAFEHARIARSVIGIEPKPPMLAFARARAKALGATNVEFREGIAEDLRAFADDTFDIAVAMYGAPFPWDVEHRFVSECERVVRSGGHIIIVGTIPGWRPPNAPAEHWTLPQGDPHGHLPTLGFAARDVVVTQDYGTISEALATWGFINGPRGIDYLLDNNTARPEAGVRIYMKGLA